MFRLIKHDFSVTRVTSLFIDTLISFGTIFENIYSHFDGKMRIYQCIKHFKGWNLITTPIFFIIFVCNAKKKRKTGVLEFEGETAPSLTTGRDRNISALKARQPCCIQLSRPGRNLCIRNDTLLGTCIWYTHRDEQKNLT